MSITDELREYTEKQVKWLDVSKVHYRKLFAIADRIDAEHEAKVSYWQGACYKDGYDEGFASADDWLAQHEDAMAEHGWIRLPKDANGEYIRIGDVMEGYGKTIEVVELRHGRSGWVLISRDGNGYADTFAFTHHAPTVEDVLREFAERYLDYEGIPSAGRRGVGEALMDEYASKLRLAEEEG